MNEETQTMSEELDDEYDVDLSDLDLSEDSGNQTDEQQEEQEETPDETEHHDEIEQEVQQDTPPETFELKFNKETRKVTLDEMTTLAQKGLNHDRILAQRDEMRSELDELRHYRDENAESFSALQEAAAAAGIDVPTFLRSLRENAYVSQGLSRETAKERVLREDTEKKLAGAQEREKKAKSQEKNEIERQNEQKKDIEKFLSTYKGVDPESIPQEVWDAVRGGESLVSAYGRYETQQVIEENRRLQGQIKAMEQNEKNKQASVGSVKADGKEVGKDPFLAAFLADDD